MTLSALSLLAFSVLPLDLNIPGTDPLILDRIVETGKSQSQVMSMLDELTTKIGPRLTGSTNGARSTAWAIKKLQEFGYANARLEEAGEVPVGFDRGKRQIAKIVAPFEKTIEFTTDAWMPGTEGPSRGPVVVAPTTVDTFNLGKDKL